MEGGGLEGKKQVADEKLKRREPDLVRGHRGDHDQRPILQLAAEKLVANQIPQLITGRNLKSLWMDRAAAGARAKEQHRALFLNRLDKSRWNINHRHRSWGACSGREKLCHGQ